jgi:hypothetical protein
MVLSAHLLPLSIAYKLIAFIYYNKKEVKLLFGNKIDRKYHKTVCKDS